MKKFFYAGAIGLALFEVLNVYFIMPLPGSQQMSSIDIAYFLHSWRWVFRVGLLLIASIGIVEAFKSKLKWVAAVVLLLACGVGYLFNFRMTADKIFLQPDNLVLANKLENTLPGDRLVIGVENNGEAKAYPIEFLAYHHQINDSVGSQPILVTYCSVCRTGRVFEPIVNGQKEQFRLVGMDHFNAMFEDATTQSWWRQESGEAIVGELKGQQLPEVESRQMTIAKWFELYPGGRVMQADEGFSEVYDPLAKFEQGKSKGHLTRTDSLSWKEKSWIVGVEAGHSSKAYDWNDLRNERIINDLVGGKFIFIVLASDGQSFAAFERPADMVFTIDSNDVLRADSTAYDFSGTELFFPSDKLRSIQASQEFWHSWRTFHPETKKYYPYSASPESDRDG